MTLSFFFTTGMSVNASAVPLDPLKARRAAFAVSVLTFAFGIMQPSRWASER